MSRLDELPPDQRAALSLLLRQRKSYGEVALLLGIAERAVHDRAHAALAVLAPRQARALSPEQREDLGDYVLGQQPGVAERLRTRVLLGSCEPARAWAQAIAAELAALGSVELPEIPAATPAARQDGPQSSEQRSPVATSPPSESPPSDSPPSSRLGGALLLGAIVVAVVVAVILLSAGGGSHGKGANAASATSSTSTAGSKKSGPTVTQRIALTAPSGQSGSLGVVEVLAEAGKYAFFIDAEHLAASQGFFYAIWLYNSPTSAEALSRSPAVGSNGKLAGGALLPSNAAEYHEILITRETNPHPTTPGQVVLRGTFSLGG